MSNTKQIIQNLKNYKPEKIILFGSHVWGKPAKDSDIDLLIIKNTKQNPYKRIPAVRRCLNNIDSAFDILVLTPQEVEKQIRLGDFFIKDIMTKGKILYEEKK